MSMDFKLQEEVINPARPEWGVGRVLSVEPGQGSGSFRVRVNFAGAGVKTLAVPPARLVRPQAAAPAVSPVAASGNSPIPDETRLQTLPEVIVDRQVPLNDRLTELVRWFRFGDDPRGIFDWAATRLDRKDPLADFSADELAQFHAQFIQRRDKALRALHREARTAGQEREFRAAIDQGGGEARKRIHDALAGTAK